MGRRLSEVVLWDVVPESRGAALRRRIRVGIDAVQGILALVSLQDPGPGRAELSEDVRYHPTRRLGSLKASGTVPGSSATVKGIVVYGDRATLELAPDRWWQGSGVEEPLPLGETELLRARPIAGPSKQPRKSVLSQWTLQVGWRGGTLDVAGPWITVAHLGCLAGWPEPP